MDYEMAEGEEYTPAVGQGECAGGVLKPRYRSFR